MTEMKLNDNEPLYKQIANYILAKIQDNTFEIGDMITPERDLTQQFDVSRVTVRKAIQELVHEGFLYRVQGKGTFVFGKDKQIKNKTNSIGVILDYSHKELESQMLTGIEEILEINDFSMTYKSSNNDYKKESETIQRMKNEGVNGLIILPAEDQKDSTAILDLKSEQFPFVLIDRRLQGCETDCVMSDNINGSYTATEYLIQLGHEKIGFVKSEFTKTSSIEDRIIGYQNALKEYGIEVEDNMIFSYDLSLDEKSKDRALHQFIKDKKPTAVLALNDYHALDIFKMCRKKGIIIPEDLSVVGFDNLDLTEHLEVPLTTIAQFPREIGYHAARLLVDKIKAGNEINKKMIHQIYYPVELVVRDSCQKVQESLNIINKTSGL